MAARLIIECERERMTFRSASYWGMEAILPTALSAVDVTARQEVSFIVRPVTLDGRCVVAGRDSNDGGQSRSTAFKASVTYLHQVGVTAVVEVIGRGELHVVGAGNKPHKCCSVAPFITSTLQQGVPRKLRMNPHETMHMAQGLYKNGLITHMHTGPTVLSG